VVIFLKEDGMELEMVFLCDNWNSISEWPP
jgi:hypothetical protein